MGPFGRLFFALRLPRVHLIVLGYAGVASAIYAFVRDTPGVFTEALAWTIAAGYAITAVVALIGPQHLSAGPMPSRREEGPSHNVDGTPMVPGSYVDVSGNPYGGKIGGFD